MNQGEAFMEGEGDAWYARNRDKPRDTRVLDAIKRNGIVPKRVLEVGCGTGWRLNALRAKYGCVSVHGLEPSMAAIQEGEASVQIYHGTAVEMQKCFGIKFDLIIFGFCLYLVDRNDLMDIVAQTHERLKDGGYIIIHDFYSREPYKREYEHKPGLFSYKQDYSRLFTGNPAYQLIDEAWTGDIGEDGCVIVHVIRKNMDAWPLKEPK